MRKRSQKTLQIFGLKRKHILTFNQSAYNKEWLGGGTSNIAGNFSLNYDFNYKKRSSGITNLSLLIFNQK
jgi:hypothetical protein